MWAHYCTREKTDMQIGDGEPCNWCGEARSADQSGAEKNELIGNVDKHGDPELSIDGGPS